MYRRGIQALGQNVLKNFPQEKNLPSKIGNQNRSFFYRKPSTGYFLSPVFEKMERDMKEIEKCFNSALLRSFNEPFFTRKGFWPNDGISGDDGKFKIVIDMGQHFKPEDIKITLMDRKLKIDAKYEVKSEELKVYQEISREFTIPDNVNVEDVKTLITPEGILSIEAPLPDTMKPKEIPITKSK